jgi:hypothetical protein
MDEISRINEVLNKHRDKSFVKRILSPGDFPRLDLGDGNYATHKMSWGEAGGKYFVYPTVLYGNGQLKEYSQDEAFGRAMETGNFIEFDNPDEADWFSKSYKKVWDK